VEDRCTCAYAFLHFAFPRDSFNPFTIHSLTNHPQLTGPYCSSKAAIHALVDSYATELAPFGIKVFGIQPGGLRTNTVRLKGYEQTLGGSLVGKVEVGSATLPESLPATATVDTTALKEEVQQQPQQQGDAAQPTLSPYMFFPSHPSYRPPTDHPTAYNEVNELMGGLFTKRAGNEPGDPVKGAAVLVDLVRGGFLVFLRYVCVRGVRGAFLFGTIACVVSSYLLGSPFIPSSFFHRPPRSKVLTSHLPSRNGSLRTRHREHRYQTPLAIPWL
jgi:hypothetical protein